MQFDKLNQLLTLIANLGVIAGILFLAIEVRQNTAMMQAQTRDSIADKLIDWQLSLGTDFYTSQAFVTGNLGAEFESTAQEISYLMLASSNFRIWENEYYQFSKGLYEEQEFLPRLNRWKDNIQREDMNYNLIWCLRRDSYSLDFQRLLDSWIQEIGGCELVTGR
ncbi:MAG: hypothetical protein RLP12_05865 [Ekhidna sp.]